MLKTGIIISFFCLLSQTTLFGQKNKHKTNKIDMYAYQLDTTKATSDTISFLFDSIQVIAQVQKNRLVTTCLFLNSKSVLTIRFYSKDKELISVKIREQSPIMSDMYSNTFLYYDKGKLFHEYYRHTVRPCMGFSKDQSLYEMYGYNPSLNADFLKKFVTLLYEKIKL
ncbi:MAG TPA: hypothetical protein P5158_04850 [Chitinophagaceae bacterium]|nr:hypothetical protein [Chitinophagaceae bacterium]MCB9055674.1 hypothetical protein [Chitinophagales bacterium]HRX93419.1 hypothetical protein [Chitinophagaceae bacterium]